MVKINPPAMLSLLSLSWPPCRSLSALSVQQYQLSLTSIAFTTYLQYNCDMKAGKQAHKYADIHNTMYGIDYIFPITFVL